MRVALVQFNSWDKYYAFDPQGVDFKVGDLVMVTTEFGQELGKLIEFQELTPDQLKEYGEIRPIDSLASPEDLKVVSANNSAKKKKDAIRDCRQVLKKYGLEMKLIDCYFSYDDRRLIFAFIADGRVDFRNAVKDLSRHFQRSIRLHQLGVRDEAKLVADVGSCGKGVCCRGHLKKLGNVSSEYAEHQQVEHRGAERLSGVCGRLKCCLAYEEEMYEDMIKKLPAKGTRVKTKHGRGEIIGWHVLKKSVDVLLDPEKDGAKKVIVEIPIVDKADGK